MHELSIALAIVDRVTEEAAQRQVRVASVHLKLGPLSGVVKEALLASYGMAAAGSPAEGSTLVIKETPVRIQCPKCGGARNVVSLQNLCCVDCGTATADIVSGRELEVVALEIIE
jgi:hydrogenase nickel incorporation protein HypA/HybF